MAAMGAEPPKAVRALCAPIPSFGLEEMKPGSGRFYRLACR